MQALLLASWTSEGVTDTLEILICFQNWSKQREGKQRHLRGADAAVFFCSIDHFQHHKCESMFLWTGFWPSLWLSAESTLKASSDWQDCFLVSRQSSVTFGSDIWETQETQQSTPPSNRVRPCRSPEDNSEAKWQHFTCEDFPLLVCLIIMQDTPPSTHTFFIFQHTQGWKPQKFWHTKMGPICVSVLAGAS